MQKLSTGMAGFDIVGFGGLPKGRPTLVAGTAGSAKTVFAMQFLVKGAELGESGVFVTFEETPADLRRNMLSLGWDCARLEE
jgi:circadian clock protein KaiC